MDPANGYVFVSDFSGYDVAVVSASTGDLVTSFNLGSGSTSTAMYFDSSNGYLYVVGQSGVLTVIDASTLAIVRHIPLGSLSNNGYWWGLVYDPILTDLIITGDGDRDLTYLNTTTDSLTNITYRNEDCYEGSWEGVYDSYSHQIFLPNVCESSVTVLDAFTLGVTTSIQISGDPRQISYDTTTGDVYVPTDSSFGSLDVVNGTNDTVVATLFPNGWFSGGETGQFAAYDPSSKLIYVVPNNDYLAVFNPGTNSTEGNIPLPGTGMNIAYDSGDSDLFVADSELTEVLTKPPPKLLDAKFVATPFPPGLTWSVKVNGARLYSTSDTVVFAEKKATYSYKVYPPGGYSATPTSGMVNLTKHNQTVSVTLTATKFYTVTFVQSGLSSGFVWSVSINGEGTVYGKSGSSSGSTISLRMPNGVWGYSEQAPSGYSVFPTGGSVTVSGTTPSPQQVMVSPEVNIGVGDEITGLAYSSWSGDTFVSQQKSGNVSVINDTTNEVVANIPVGIDPEAIVSNPVNQNILVANWGSSNLSVINGSTLKVVASIGVGSDPSFLYYDPVVQEVYVSNAGSDTVSAISVKTDSVVATISVAGSPQWIAEDLSTGYLYVANADSCPEGTGTCYPVSVISDSTNQVVTNIESLDLGTYTAAPSIAYDPSNQDVYLLGSTSVFILSTANDSFFQSLPLGASTFGSLLYDPVTGNLLVSGHNASVTVVDSSTNEILKSVPVAAIPGDMTYVSISGLVYIAESGGRSIAAFDASTQSLTAQFTVASEPTGFSFDPIISNLYVGCSPNTVSVVFPPKTVAISSWPAITNVTTFANSTSETITVTGSGFGIDPATVALTDGSVDTVQSQLTPSIVIADSGNGSDNWSAGHETTTNHDAIGIHLESWSDTQIVIDGFGSELGPSWHLSVGDPVSIDVFGPQSDGAAKYSTTVVSSARSAQTGSTASLLNTYYVNSAGAITSREAIEDYGPRTCEGCGESPSWSGLSNSSYSDGSSHLQITSGTSKDTQIVEVNFTTTSSSYSESVFDTLVYNTTQAGYGAHAIATIIPLGANGTGLSDLIELNYSSSLSTQLSGLEKALLSIGESYLASVSSKLNLQGLEYLAMRLAISNLTNLLPTAISKLYLLGTTIQVIDPALSADGTCSQTWGCSSLWTGPEMVACDEGIFQGMDQYSFIQFEEVDWDLFSGMVAVLECAQIETNYPPPGPFAAVQVEA